MSSATTAKIRRFAETYVAPLSEQMDREGALDPGLREQLFTLGIMGAGIPIEYGGGGQDLHGLLTTIEQLSTVDPGVAVAVDVHTALVVPAILANGTGDQRRRYLPLLAARSMGAFALSERESGSDAFAMRTVVCVEGNGYVLNGTKSWTSNAGSADVFLVFAKHADSEQISAFLVDRDTPGVNVRRVSEQIGVRAAHTMDLILKDVRLRRTTCLGGLGGGRKLAATVLTTGRLGIAAQLIGLANGALKEAKRYTAGRRQFGERILDYQAVRFQLAQLDTEVTAARALLYETVRRERQDDISIAAAMAKLFASQVAVRAVDAAVDLHGGNGITNDYRVARFYRDAKVGTIYEGTTNVLLRTIGTGFDLDSDLD